MKFKVLMSLMAYLDRISLEITDAKQHGISSLSPKTAIILFLASFLVTSFTSDTVDIILILLAFLVLIGGYYFARLWVHLRNLRPRQPDAIIDVNIFNLTLQQSSLLNSIKCLSSSMWSFHHEDKYKGKTYTAMEEELIKLDRERAKTVRKFYPILERWDDKPIVEAINIYEQSIVKTKVDLLKKQSSFLDYLCLSELSGHPLKSIPSAQEIGELLASIPNDSVRREEIR